MGLLLLLLLLLPDTFGKGPAKRPLKVPDVHLLSFLTGAQMNKIFYRNAERFFN